MPLLSPLCFYGILQYTKSFDLYNNLIAMFQLTYTCRCSRENQIARIESHDRRNISNQNTYIENHITRGGHLAHLPIHAAGDYGIRRIEIRIDPRPKRTKRIK